jgi:hypothetical protein
MGGTISALQSIATILKLDYPLRVKLQNSRIHMQ